MGLRTAYTLRKARVVPTAHRIALASSYCIPILHP